MSNLHPDVRGRDDLRKSTKLLRRVENTNVRNIAEKFSEQAVLDPKYLDENIAIWLTM